MYNQIRINPQCSSSSPLAAFHVKCTIINALWIVESRVLTRILTVDGMLLGAIHPTGAAAARLSDTTSQAASSIILAPLNRKKFLTTIID